MFLSPALMWSPTQATVMKRAKVLAETQYNERGRRARVSGTRQMDRQTQIEHVRNVEHRSRRILHTSLPWEAQHLPVYKDLLSLICNRGMTSTSSTEVRTSFLPGYLTTTYRVCTTIKCALLTDKWRQDYIQSKAFTQLLFSGYTVVNKCMPRLLLIGSINLCDGVIVSVWHRKWQ